MRKSTSKRSVTEKGLSSCPLELFVLILLLLLPHGVCMHIIAILPLPQLCCSFVSLTVQEYRFPADQVL